MKFTEDIRKTTIEYRKELVKKEAERQKWIDDNRFEGSPYQKEQIDKARFELDALKKEAIDTLDGINAKYQAELLDRYTPHGEDLTDDAKILTSGIELSNEEIQEYARRYKDNLTMLRLVSDYAKKHNPNVIIKYISKDSKIARAERVATYCKSAVTDELLFNSVIVDDNGFNKICGEELEND